MELLLNLVWLLLALPAYWLWSSSRTRTGQQFTSLQCLLILGCVLVVLFPVISATDDLRAMRTEMEESPASKRSFRQTTAEKASPWNSRPQTQPAIVSAFVPFVLGAEFHILPTLASFSVSATPLAHTGRAPPLFSSLSHPVRRSPVISVAVSKAAIGSRNRSH
jgi:hypothetical protein